LLHEGGDGNLVAFILEEIELGEQRIVIGSATRGHPTGSL
jgi:hypothetical protein